MIHENAVIAAGMGIMLLGLLVQIGLFDRIGPIRTQRDLRRLALILFATGFVTILTQSHPT